MDYKIYNPGNREPFKKRLRTLGIIQHHAAVLNCTPADIVRWHLQRGFNGAGYNFFVAKDGTKYQLRPVWATGAHTIGCNSSHIGICAEGNFELEEMPEAQRKAIAEVVDYCNDYYKTKLPVYPHKAKWATACPGKNYPFSSIVDSANHWDDKPMFSYPGVVYKLKDKLMYATAIRAIQQRLNEMGFNCGKTDGWFGKNTDKAVKSFQMANHLQPDGDVGPKTWEALFN